MDEDGVDPSTINKSPHVLKSAVEDVNKLDVLVCGRCLRVCHFIEEFKLHKITDNCGDGKDSFEQVDREKKAGAVENTWAFLLWKNAQYMNSGLSTLTLYQQWRRLPEDRKEAWIIAGQSIQRFKILSHAKIQGVQNNEALPLSKVKAQLNKVVGTGKENTKVESKNVVQQLLKRVVQTLPVNKDDEQLKKKQAPNNLPNKDGLSNKVSQINSHLVTGAISETEETSLLMSPRREEKLLREEFEEENNGVGNENEKSGETNGVKSDKEVELPARDLVEEQKTGDMTYDEATEIKTEILSDVDNKSMSDKEDTENRPPLLKSAPSQNTNMLSRRIINKDMNAGDSSEDEYVVEKILAKRYNPRKKHFEYLLKWEGYPHDQNTWEPVQNMATCVELVKTFEQNLAKQRAAQEQQKRLAQANFVSTQKQAIKPEKFSTSVKVEPSTPSPIDISSTGRPVRNSKKKAMGRMKTWCGSIGREDDEHGGKRKAESSSDSDEGMPSKKIKLEPEDDYDDYGMDDSGNESSEEDKGIVWRQRNTNLSQNRQTKAGSIIVKSKDQFTSGIKKIPGIPLKKLADDSSNVNGMSAEDDEKNEEDNDLAVQLGLESPNKQNSPGKSSQPPVLVANSKGVVKVDPCQLPNLTSGVYIVANKSPVEIPVKPKVDVKQVPLRKPEPGSQLLAGQTGIVRKPLLSSGSATNTEQGGTESLKLPKSGLVLNPAAISAMGGAINKKPLLNPALQNNRPKLASPRLLGPRPGGLVPRPRLLGPRPELGQRPKLLGPRAGDQSSPGMVNRVPPATGQSPSALRSAPAAPGTRPRLPLLRPTPPSGVFRPTLGGLAAKRGIGIPGVQTKIISAVKPRLPGQKVLSPLSAQTKSGVKPIQAMLGGTVSPATPLAELAAAKRAARIASIQAQRDAAAGFLKRGLSKSEVVKGRGRGRGGPLLNPYQDVEAKQRESKLVDTDGVHMEFHQETSDSESDDNLPDLPMGDLPPLEPPSPPRPLTLCPITGKILSRAEGERTPPPSPELCKQEETFIHTEGNMEEIIPDQRDSSPMRINEDGEMLLKVEMSPGGTTSKVVRESNAENGETFGVIEGSERLTVTKIADDVKNAVEMVRSVQVMKGPGGISVPATKLSLGANDMNTELVTMGDGVVYQISKEDREALEGGQHCVYVTTEQMEEGEEPNPGMLTLNTAVAEAVAQMGTVPERLMAERSGCSQFYVRESESSDDLVMATVVDATDAEGNPESELVTHMVRQGELIPGTRVILQTEDGTSVVYSQEVESDKEGNVVTHIVEGEDGQVAEQEGDGENIVHTDAQIVGGGDINPETGKRRVLLLLPNGQLMVTDVEEEIEDEGEQTGDKNSLNQLLFPSKEFS